MRSLVISNAFPPKAIGGYELGAKDVADFLHNEGHDVLALTSPEPRWAQLDTATHLRHPVVRTLQSTNLAFDTFRDWNAFEGAVHNEWNIGAIHDVMDEFQPDVVLLFNLSGLGPFSILRYFEGLGVPCAAVFMDNYFSTDYLTQPLSQSIRDTIGWPFLTDRIGIFAMSRSLVSEVSEALGLNLEARSLPGWCKDNGDIPRAVQRQRKFVFSSRIDEHKGAFRLLDALAVLRNRKVDNWVVDFFGAGMTARLHQEIAVRDLSDVCRYAGSVTKQSMSQRFGDYDALLFPTWSREPFGFVVPEAAQAGCVPIMTRGVGAGEFFHDGRDSIFVSGGPDDWADAICRLVVMEDAELERMRADARHTSLSTLNQNLILPKFIQELQDMSKRSSPLRFQDARKVALACNYMGVNLKRRVLN